MAGQIQEICALLGGAATINNHLVSDSDKEHFGSKPRFRVHIRSERNLKPRIGWTKQDRSDQVGIAPYNGNVHCVTVPNGVVLVRKNGVPVWSGNTPFEQSSFTFYVKCPIFVAREWFRHRIGSFNEISGRYTKMNTEFYVPKTFRVPSEARKQMDYKYENADETTNALARSAVTEATSYLTNVYNYLINPPYQEGEEEPEGGWGLGVAKEHARLILPLNLYTEFRWTVNARSLMNFLALRTHPTAMKEIRLYAMWIEQLFKNEMPVTHAAWIQNEKVAP